MKDTSKREKRNPSVPFAAVLAVFAGFIIAFISLSIAAAIFEVFALQAAAHIIIKVLYVPLILLLLKRCFKEQITESMNAFLWTCGIALFVDTVAVSCVRYIFSHGENTVLFFPVCIPIILTAAILFAAKDSTVGNKAVKWAFIIGIPLTLVASVFEVLSFVG